MKKIAIIGTNGLPGRYGGWDQLMEHLTIHLSAKYLFFVYCTSINNKFNLKTYNNAKLVYIPLKANGWQSFLYDIAASLHAMFYADSIILLGGGGTIMFPFLRFRNIDLIYHPDGIEWKRAKWSKLVKCMLRSFEQIGIAWSDKIVSDNIEIQKYILEKYNKKSYLIEYGSDHVLDEDLSVEISMKFGISKGSYAFKVCRIEPENNIGMILESFKNASVKLIIVGNWANSKYGIKLRNIYRDFENIILLDPIYEQKKLDELRSNCGIYIHGHSVGGTNPSLVEAMYLGLNIFAFDVSFNRATTEGCAIYFKSSIDLKDLVNKFFSNKSVFNHVGSSLKVIAFRRYLWKDITLSYDILFEDKKSYL
jgi:hypothetical protein